MAAAGRAHGSGLRRSRHSVPPERGVRHRAAGRAELAAALPAAGGPCHRGTLQGHKVRRRGHQQRHSRRAERRAGQPAAGARHLSGYGAHPPVRRFCRPRGCRFADGRQHRLERGKTAASERLRPPHCHHQRDGRVLFRSVRHPADRRPLRHDGGGRGADVHFGLYARVHFGPHCLRRIPVLRDRPDQFCAQFHPAPDAGNRASDRPAVPP